MFELLLGVLALGIASAIAPVMFLISVSLIASRAEPMKRLLLYLLGGVVAVVIVFTVALLGFGGGAGEEGFLGTHNKTLDGALGAILIILGVFTLFSKGNRQADFDSIKGNGLFFMGLLLYLFNKSQVMVLAAVREIVSAKVGVAEEAVLLLLTAFFFLFPSIFPLLCCIAAPAQAKLILDPIGAFLKKYGKYLVFVVLLLVGSAFLLRGLAA